MDTPRRWQLASTATAVAGLSVGALLLGRPVSDRVEPIDLDQVTMIESRSGDGEVTAGRQAPTDRPTDIRPESTSPEPAEPEIVQPRVIEDQLSDDPPSSEAAGDDSPDTPDTPDTPDSPDSVDSPDSLDTD